MVLGNHRRHWVSPAAAVGLHRIAWLKVPPRSNPHRLPIPTGAPAGFSPVSIIYSILHLRFVTPILGIAGRTSRIGASSSMLSSSTTRQPQQQQSTLNSSMLSLSKSQSEIGSRTYSAKEKDREIMTAADENGNDIGTGGSRHLRTSAIPTIRSRSTASSRIATSGTYNNNVSEPITFCNSQMTLV